MIVTVDGTPAPDVVQAEMRRKLGLMPVPTDARSRPARRQASPEPGVSDTKPPPAPPEPVVLDLEWLGDHRLRGRAGDVEMTMDSPPVAGPSPVQALAFGLAGCMAIDVLVVMKRGRFDVKGLTRPASWPSAPRPTRKRIVKRGPALHGEGRRPGRPRAARDRALARQVLLGLALDAAGHRSHHELRDRPGPLEGVRS